MAKTKAFVVIAGLVAVAGACAHQRMFPDTNIPITDENKAIIETIDKYRQQLIAKNVEGLLLLAASDYFEDSGTPTAEDDYGYEGLKFVLVNRLARLKSLRYDIKFRNIERRDGEAQVEVFLSGAFELVAESGDRYRRVSDYHRFVLVQAGGNKWKFKSGM